MGYVYCPGAPGAGACPNQTLLPEDMPKDLLCPECAAAHSAPPPPPPPPEDAAAGAPKSAEHSATADDDNGTHAH